ncbi:MAG: DUF748 domain-containing protein, partial [Candidatus Omnitrophica bacterium]|nr:DUF748 domain-containing protein [Candidatus Omnitrophota bacterium]
MKKKNIIIVIVLLVFLFLSLGLIYLNNIFLPKVLKEKIIAGLEDYFQQDVQIQRLRYNLFKGLVIQDLSIYDKIKDTQHITLELKEICLNPLILPFSKNRVIIPLIRIDSPKIYLRYQKDKTLNLLPLFTKKPSQKSRWMVLVAKIRIQAGRIQFSDENILPPYKKELVDLDMGIDFGFKKEARFLLEAKIPNAHQLPSKINMAGAYDIAGKTLKVQLKSNSMILAEYKPYLENLGWTTSFRKIYGVDIIEQIGYLKDIYLDCTILKDKLNILQAKFEAVNARFNLSGSIQNFKSPNFSLNITSENLKLPDLIGLFPAWGDVLKIQGEMNLNMDIYSSSNKSLNAQGTVQIKDASIITPYLKSPLTE